MMLRDRLTSATLVVLFFSLLVGASGGLWLMLQAPPGSEAVSGTLLGLGQDQVLSSLMILSLINLVLLVGYLGLHWPVLAAGLAALLPNPTVRGLATAVAALGGGGGPLPAVAGKSARPGISPNFARTGDTSRSRAGFSPNSRSNHGAARPSLASGGSRPLQAKAVHRAAPGAGASLLRLCPPPILAAASPVYTRLPPL